MIYAYGVTEQGAYHVKKGTVCQDAHRIIKRGPDMAVAAVADGVGSAKYSDIASKIAADTAVAYCAENISITDSESKILNTIKISFALAQGAVEKKVKLNGHDIDQYDTTLSLAVMINDTLYYGHSGDSGIIALTTDGKYEKVTEQQRDEDGHVFPLFFRECWVFGRYEKSVCAVLLATDGIFDVFFPIYIRNEPVNIHVSLARYFMDEDCLSIAERGEEAVQAQMKEYISSIPEAQISDDKTLAVLINTSVEKTAQPDEYYEEPDWAALKQKWDEEWKRKAYL